MEPVLGSLKHDIHRAELHFSLVNGPESPYGGAKSPITLESVLDTLGDDLQDFFFGCTIRDVTSLPFKTARPHEQYREDATQQDDMKSFPLKTVQSWLNIPDDTASGEQGKLASLKVEVRIFKPDRSGMQNPTRKCGRCLRYHPVDRFSQVSLDDFLPVTIDGGKSNSNSKRVRGICCQCERALTHTTATEEL